MKRVSATTATAVACILVGWCSSVRAAESPAWAMYDVRTSTSATLQIQAPAEAGRVLFLDATGSWREAQCERKDGVRMIHIDVAKIANGATTVLVDPPASLNIEDRLAPEVKELLLDGQPLAVQPVLDLKTLASAPKTLVVTLVDDGSQIRPDSVILLLDGARLSAACQPAKEGRQLVCTVTLPGLEFGPHELVIRAADASPFRNRVERSIRFVLADNANVAQAALGAEVKVDSLYTGYAAAPLIDGDWQSCANSGSSSLTWASAENEVDHWVEIKLARPEKIETATVYWAYKRPAKRIEAQVQKGGAWTTVAMAEAKASQQASTTLRFSPLTTDTIRILQPAGCGSSERPNLAWIGEITVGKAK